MGIKDLSLLNGNIDDWIRSGYSTQMEYLEKQQNGAEYELNEDCLMKTGKVLEIIDDPDYQLIDIRSKREYEGGENEYNYDIK